MKYYLTKYYLALAALSALLFFIYGTFIYSLDPQIWIQNINTYILLVSFNVLATLLVTSDFSLRKLLIPSTK